MLTAVIFVQTIDFADPSSSPTGRDQSVPDENLRTHVKTENLTVEK
jgi:hypothetical protein